MEPTNTTNQNLPQNVPIPQPTEIDRNSVQMEAELKTRFDLLPTGLQEVILSEDYQMKLFEIAKKNKLTYDKLGELELETTMVLLGMTPPDEFKLDISEQVELKGETLDTVIKDINDQIFVPIREQLMGIYSKEEVEMGEKFAQETTTNTNQVVETKPVASPYREPIITKTSPSSTLTINKSAVPTYDKNESDSKKELTSDTSKGTQLNPVTIGLSTTPITPKDIAPIVSPLKMDPYRELPIDSNERQSAGIAQPAKPLHDEDATEFLKGIQKISIDTNTAGTKKIDTLEIAKGLGAVNTMKTAATTITQIQPNQSETLKGIANLKNILNESLSKPVTLPNLGESIVPKMVEDIKKIPDLEIPKIALEKIEIKTEVISPIVSKNEPTIEIPPLVKTENPLGSTTTMSSGISLKSDTVATVAEDKKSTDMFSDIPKIVSNTISLKNVTIDTPGEIKQELKDTKNSIGTSDLIRNIKLQVNEVEKKELFDTAPKIETVRKIDTMMQAKEREMAPPVEVVEKMMQENRMPVKSMPTSPNTDIFQRSSGGAIYEKDLDMLGGKVQKTGFFGKMKNFFGGQKQRPLPEEQEIVQNPPTPLPKMEPFNPKMTNAPIIQMTAAHMPEGPVNDSDVDNVKIFDEIVVPKQ